MPNRCNVLTWLYPAFAEVVEPACGRHDERYIARKGTRIGADTEWFISALKLVWTSGKYHMIPFCLIAFLGLLIGGWYLWYDLDVLLEEAISWVRWKYHRVRNAIDKVF